MSSLTLTIVGLLVIPWLFRQLWLRQNPLPVPSPAEAQQFSRLKSRRTASLSVFLFLMLTTVLFPKQVNGFVFGTACVIMCICGLVLFWSSAEITNLENDLRERNNGPKQ